MHLSDEEIVTILKKFLSSLKQDGYLFIRESCFNAEGMSSFAYLEIRIQMYASYPISNIQYSLVDLREILATHFQYRF